MARRPTARGSSCPSPGTAGPWRQRSRRRPRATPPWRTSTSRRGRTPQANAARPCRGSTRRPPRRPARGGTFCCPTRGCPPWRGRRRRGSCRVVFSMGKSVRRRREEKNPESGLKAAHDGRRQLLRLEGGPGGGVQRERAARSTTGFFFFLFVPSLTACRRLLDFLFNFPLIATGLLALFATKPICEARRMSFLCCDYKRLGVYAVTGAREERGGMLSLPLPLCAALCALALWPRQRRDPPW